MVAAAFAMVMPLGGAHADEPLTFEGTVPDLNAQGPTRLVGNLLYIMPLNAVAGGKRLVAVDLETRQATVIADDLPDVRIVAASERKVALGSEKNDGNLIVLDRLDHSRADLCCFIHATSGAFIGETLRLVYDGGGSALVYSIDLARPTAAPEHKSLANSGVAAYAADRLLLVSQHGPDPQARSTVTILGPDLGPVGSVTIPNHEIRHGRECPVDASVADRTHLLYVSDCGRIGIVDLDQRKLVRLLPYFSPAGYYGLAVSGNIGFAAPRGTSEPVLAFDIASGRQLATLPISATHLQANDRFLVAINGDSYPGPNIAIYTIHAAVIRDVPAAVATVVSRIEREVATLASGSSVQSALAAIEAQTVAPLLDHLDLADARAVDAAIAYARLLARTVDRIPEGVALLQALAGRAADPDAIAAYLDAAKARLAIRGGESPSESLVALAPGTEALTLPDGGGMTITKDRIYFWAGRVPAGMSGVCATVAAYDRATLREQAIVPVVRCDDDPDGGFQDSVTDVAEGDDTYIAIEYRFEQAGRTDLIVLKNRDPSRVERRALLGSIEDLAVTPGGLLACGPAGGPCALFDPQNFAAVPEDRLSPQPVCQPTGPAFPKVPAPPTVAERKRQGETIALCSERYFAAADSRGDRGWVRIYDVAAPDRRIAELPGGSGWQGIRLSEDAGSAVVLETLAGQSMWRSVRLGDGRVRPELQLAVDPAFSMDWAVDRDVLFVARGRDLLVYDLAAGEVLDYLPRIIPEPTDDSNGVDTHRVSFLVVDPAMDRLLVLTVDGHYSRAIPITPLVTNLRSRSSAWRAAGAVLAGAP
jgi:hypothetical protein